MTKALSRPVLDGNLLPDNAGFSDIPRRLQSRWTLTFLIGKGMGFNPEEASLMATGTVNSIIRKRQKHT